MGIRKLKSTSKVEMGKPKARKAQNFVNVKDIFT